jgi:hypothetical protein
MKIYVASSWKNIYQPSVVNALRNAGHEVYDFRDSRGFRWSDIIPIEDTVGMTSNEVVQLLSHPVARFAFDRDMDALKACDACVLVMPCGRSAHLELGWAQGAGKLTFVILGEKQEPDLMHLMAYRIVSSVDNVISYLARRCDKGERI